MKGWKQTLFGETWLSFWGWIVAGLLVMGSSFSYVSGAIRSAAAKSPEAPLLLAIYLVLLGQFGLMLSSYLPRVLGKLNAPSDKPSEKRPLDRDSTV